MAQKLTQRGVVMIRLSKLVSAGVLAAMLGGSFAVAAPAAHSGSLELFADPHYKARIGYRTTTGSWNISRGNNDTLSSVKNHTNWSAAFWYDAHQGGHCWDYSPKTDDPYFWWYDDNQASSFALGRGC